MSFIYMPPPPTPEVVLPTGDALPGDVRQGKGFSNGDGTGKTGTLPVQVGGSVTPTASAITKSAGIYDDPIIINGVTVPADKVLAGTTIAGTPGTMVNRGAVAITPGPSAQAIPAGFHNGSGSVAGVVVPAANVLVGTTIAGTAGTMPNRSAENNHMPGVTREVFPGDRYFIQPPAGYYNGATWVAASEPQLIASNIRNGANIGGIVGNLIEGKPTIQGTISQSTTGHMVVPCSFDPIAYVFWQGTGSGATGHAKLLGMLRNASNGNQTDGPLVRFMFSAADMDYTSSWYSPSQGTLTVRTYGAYNYSGMTFNYIIYAR